MPWMNLRFLLGVLRSRGVDPVEVSVYVSQRDAARLQRRLPVDTIPDSDGPEPDEDDTQETDQDDEAGEDQQED
jgi:hypothetical protein